MCAVQHLVGYFGRSDGHKTCSALFLVDLKKTLAVLLDNIMLRLGKLEAKVENIYNGTGGNLTNGTSTATPSATNSEKVNVAGKHRVCLLLISKAELPGGCVVPGVAKRDLSPSLDSWSEGEMAFLHDREGGKSFSLGLWLICGPVSTVSSSRETIIQSINVHERHKVAETN